MNRIEYLSPILGSLHITLIVFSVFGFLVPRAELSLSKDKAIRAELEALLRLPNSQELTQESEKRQIEALRYDSEVLAKKLETLLGVKVTIDDLEVSKGKANWNYREGRRITDLITNLKYLRNSLVRIPIHDNAESKLFQLMSLNEVETLRSARSIHLLTLSIGDSWIHETSDQIAIHFQQPDEIALHTEILIHDKIGKTETLKLRIPVAPVRTDIDTIGVVRLSELFAGMRKSSLYALDKKKALPLERELAGYDLVCSPEVIRDSISSQIDDIEGRIEVLGIKVDYATCRFFLAVGVALTYTFCIAQCLHANDLPPGTNESLLTSRFVGFHDNAWNNISFAVTFYLLPLVSLGVVYSGAVGFELLFGDPLSNGSQLFSRAPGIVETIFVYVATVFAVWTAISCEKRLYAVRFAASGKRPLRTPAAVCLALGVAATAPSLLLSPTFVGRECTVWEFIALYMVYFLHLLCGLCFLAFSDGETKPKDVFYAALGFVNRFLRP